MSDLERRSGSQPSRRRREQRAYNLVMVGGTAAFVTVVAGLLALFTSFPWSIAIIAAIVAVLCSVLFRRSVR